jgi:glycosyltransferase A (GT-A) superfamily protein (DUF2064 family)
VAAWLLRCGCDMPVAAQAASPDLGARMLAAMAAAAAGPTDGGCCEPGTAAATGPGPGSAATAAAVPAATAALGAPPPPLPAAARPTAVLVAGTDVPDLSAGVLSAATAALREWDAVLGPAADGGYYLLGLRAELLAGGFSPARQPGCGTPAQPGARGRTDSAAAGAVAAGAAAGAAAAGGAEAAARRTRPRAAPLFEGIPWSTAGVAAATRRAAAAAGLRMAPEGALPVLRDVDTLADLRLWAASAAARPGDGGGGGGSGAHPLLPAAAALLGGAA